jgi:protein-disulfide isomerase
MTTETKIMVGVLIISVVIVVGGSWLYQRSVDQQSQPEVLTSNQEALVRENSIKIQATGEEKLVVVEFADYECPACAAVAPRIKELVEQYGENVTFVFRDFPLTNIHPNATIAARMVRIAGEQDKYWEMHDLMFAKQAEWAAASDPSDLFVGYAGELGMNTSDIKTKLSSDVYESEVKADVADANLLRVNSTPTFFVGDRIIRTANIGLVQQTIEEKLQ